MKQERNKIYFLPYHPQRGRRSNLSKEPYAVVDTKYGYLSINASSIRQLGMDKKFMKLYFEPDRNIVGWKLTDRLTDDFKLWKMVKVNKAGQFRIHIGGILPHFKNLKRSYRADISKYFDKDYLEGDTYYFIRLSKENIHDTTKRNKKLPIVES